MIKEVKNIRRGMTYEEAIELMINETTCVKTADAGACDRDCGSCPLVVETRKVLEAYDMAIEALNDMKRAVKPCEKVDAQELDQVLQEG